MKYLIPILFMLLISCEERKEDGEIIVSNIPSYFPEYTIPEDNQPTPDRIKLGEKLFFSTKFSRDNSISCGSCHLPDVAFANNDKTTPGVYGREGTRNVPSLLNVLFQKRLLREGSVPTLEQQVLVPVQEHNEFDNDWVEILERLNSDEEFLTLLDKSNYIFPADGKKLTKFNLYAVVNPLAAYQRTLLSINSKYDKYLQGKKTLSEEEEIGRKLFFSDSLNCGKCHSGALFTNFDYYNNGLYEEYEDAGKARISNKDEDIGKFKVSSLRNVEITYPYMFDGSVSTLEDVIMHYESGGSNHKNKSNIINGFKLTQNERNALISFLKTLTEE